MNEKLKKKLNKEKVLFKLHTTTKFLRLLDKYKTHYELHNEPEFLTAPYVFMCAAALECRLNDAIVDYLHKTWRDDYREFTDTYLNVQFLKKLELVVPLLTNNRYKINKENDVYKRLSSLISARNKLAHSKTYFEEVEVYVRENPHPFRYAMTEDYYKKIDDLTFGCTTQYSPIEYHDALKKLERYFFSRCPNKLSKIALVVQNVTDTKE